MANNFSSLKTNQINSSSASPPPTLSIDKTILPDFSWTRFGLGLTIILIAAAIAYVAIAVNWTKFSRAEVFFAECAREMLATNNWVTPLYHRQPFFDKPILSYWLIIACFKGFGQNHLAARIPSVVSALLTVALTGYAAASLFSRRIGLIAASMLASSFMFLSFASLCMSDMLLVFFDTLTLTLAYCGLKDQRRIPWFFYAAALSSSLGFLTKGPIALILPSLSFFLFLIITRRITLLSFKTIGVCLAIVVLVATPWFVAAYKVNGLSAIIYFFVHENLQRFTSGVYDAHRSPFYTVSSFFAGFAPWSLFIPLVAWQDIQRFRHKRLYQNSQQQELSPTLQAHSYLWLWIILVVAFFCCSKGKCDYYVLPTYPAAAMLAASYWGELQRGRLQYMAFVICGGIAAATTIFACWVLPSIIALVPINRYAQLINAQPSNTTVLIDPSLYSWLDEITFQTGRHPILFKGQGDLARRLASNESYIIIAKSHQLNDVASKLHILRSEHVITHSLTPGFLLTSKGHLTDLTPVVVAINGHENKTR